MARPNHQIPTYLHFGAANWLHGKYRCQFSLHSKSILHGFRIKTYFIITTKCEDFTLAAANAAIVWGTLCAVHLMSMYDFPFQTFYINCCTDK
jgi:hypothetical protein